MSAEAASQPQMKSAILWLRSNTILGKLSDLQIRSALQAALDSGKFAVSFDGTALSATS